MAIGRITGPMLFNNLERQGVDLAIDGNLIYADVTNRRVGINQSSPQYSVDAPGNVRFANITILGNTITSNTGKIGLGSAANIVVTGGASYDILYTDGQGNLQFGSAGILPVILSVNANVTAANSAISTLQEYDIWANANAASQATSINSINANIDAYSTYANANAATQATSINSINANIGAYDIWANANAATQATSINTINANLGAYQIYANANIGTITTSLETLIQTLNANVGAYDIWANANAATQATSIDTINANIGAYQTYANANIGTITTSLQTLNANVGAFEIYANANAAFQATSIDTINANVGAYEIYANAQILLRANIASPTFTGTVTIPILSVTSNITSSGNVWVANTTASTSTTTGALVVDGGAGIAGNVFVGNILTNGYYYANSAPVAWQTQNDVAAYLPTYSGNIAAGNIIVTSEIHANTITTISNGVMVINSTSAIKVPTGTTVQRPSGATGELRFNTDIPTLEYFAGSGWIPITNTITDQQITPNGSTNVFTLDQESNTIGAIVSINGTLQQPTIAYTISGNQITFTEIPQSTDLIDIRFLGAMISINSTLTDDLFVSGNVTASYGIGLYSGGTVTQNSNRQTAVTINKPSGAITMYTDSGSPTPLHFVVNNSYVGANDVIILNIKSGAPTNYYVLTVGNVSTGSFTINFYSQSGTATDTPVISFAVIRGSVT